MFKKINKYDSITSFCSVCEFGIQNGKILNFLSGETIQNEHAFLNVMSSDDVIIFTDDLNYPFVLDGNRLVDKYSKIFRVSYLKKSLILFYKKGPQKTEGVWDAINDNILFEGHDYVGSEIIDGLVFGELNKSIFSKSIENGILIWSLDISEIGYYEHPFENLRNQVEVQQFVGIYEDVLWVFLRNRTFLGIDIHKGEVIHKITAFEENAHLNNDYDKSWGLTSQEKLNEYISTMLPLIPDTNWYLDEGNAKIKGLAGYSYVEVDLSGLDSEKKGGLLEGVFSFIKKAKTPSLTVRHFFGQLNSLGYSNLLGRRTVIDEVCKYIYFMLANTGRWGIYNTHDYTFEYISEPVVPEELVAQQKLGSLKEIKQGGGKVYILDMQNTLHIFEKEETV